MRPSPSPKPDALNLVTNFAFDTVGNVTSISDPGGTAAGFTTSFYYDFMRRLTRTGSPSVPVTVTYGYDSAGNRQSTLWPDGYQAWYVYDGLNRMQDVYEGASGGALLAHYSYDLLSRRHDLTFGGSSANKASYGYEANNDLSALTHQMGTIPALTFGYSRNASRQITGLTASDSFYLPTPVSASTTQYGVNALNEYTGVGATIATGGTPMDDGLDPGGTSVVYDLNGNLRRWASPDRGRSTYTYDSQNRLRTATTSTRTVTYDYDGLGRRITKTVD